jgi:hypothetical protein
MPDRTRPRTNGGGVQSQINELRHALVGDSPGQPQWERTSAILDRFAQFASYGFGATSPQRHLP